MIEMSDIFEDAEEEFYRITRGRDYESPEHLLSVLVEEVGEVARAINDNDKKQYREELIQVMAVAAAMIKNS